MRVLKKICNSTVTDISLGFSCSEVSCTAVLGYKGTIEGFRFRTQIKTPPPCQPEPHLLNLGLSLMSDLIEMSETCCLG